MKSIHWFWFLTLLVSCRDEPLSSCSSLSIFGGQHDNSHDFQSVVSLKKRDENGQLSSYCSAVMITPNTALSAAHCFFDIEGKQRELKDIFLSSPEMGNKRVSPSRVVIHEGYKHTTNALELSPWENRDDIAIITLKEEFASKSIIPEATFFAPQDNYQFFLSGFGNLGRVSNANEQRYSVETDIVNPFSLKEIVVGDRKATGCSGDSGGAVFVNGENGRKLLVGIMVRVHSLEEDLVMSCEDGRGTVVTVLSMYRSWLMEHIGRDVLSRSKDTPNPSPSEAPTPNKTPFPTETPLPIKSPTPNNNDSYQDNGEHKNSSGVVRCFAL